MTRVTACVLALLAAASLLSAQQRDRPAAPAPPPSWSLPDPPQTLSSPEPPSSLSLPAIPATVSALAPPNSMLLPVVPFK